MAVLVCSLEARKKTSTGGGLWIWAVRDILQGKERITFPFSGDGGCLFGAIGFACWGRARRYRGCQAGYRRDQGSVAVLDQLGLAGVLRLALTIERSTCSLLEDRYTYSSLILFEYLFLAR